MRTLRILAFGIPAAVGLATSAAAADISHTTRVEPRPFYGATVTLEEGVRVFRPLPPHDRVIINPGNATPVTITVGDGPGYPYYRDGHRR
jgi:hypothetical protein